MKLNCSWPGCQYETPEMGTEDLAVQLLAIHTESHKAAVPPAAPANPAPPPEKLRRPSIQSGSTLENWNFFVSRWQRFKTVNNIAPNSTSSQLLESCEEELLFLLHRTHGSTLDNMNEDTLLSEIKKLAVKCESIIINRVKMRAMTQDHQEDIRHYAARLKGQSNLCEYVVKCPTCEVNVSYSDTEITDQLVTGIADSEIQKELLAYIEDQPTLDKVVTFIESREVGKRSQTALGQGASGNISRISQYRKEKASDKIAHQNSDDPESELCSWCGHVGHGRQAIKSVRNKLCPAYKHKCKECLTKGHYESMCRHRWVKQSSNSSRRSVSTIGFVGGIDCATIVNGGINIDHAEFGVNGWVTKQSKDHPQVTVSLEICKDDYPQFNISPPSKPIIVVNRVAVADTGAMTMVAGKDLLTDLGLTVSDLIPVNIKLKTAGNIDLKILGAILLKVGGRNYATKQICYIQDEDSKIYLSRNACENLGIISKSFPSIGDHFVNRIGQQDDVHAEPIAETGCISSIKGKCDCPKRTKPPKAPEKLPFPATPENRDKLKSWILDQYKSSSFNICEKQGLQKMSGPPMRIEVDETATPTAVHKPIPVPIHWRNEVKAQLDRDVELGVIEPVPWGEPVTWCSRMILVAKNDGSPRRTVDLKSLNDASVRQTHHTQPPFQQAMSVPHNTKKTVLDAWNGYHSLAIREEDRHLTSFITPWGRYRYCSATQGFLASGDAYTKRFDDIIAHLPNKTKCIDDTLLWEEDLEKSFFQTCEFLTICGNNGITLNPNKFQFAEETVKFAGFQITPTGVQPSKEFLEAILNFPTPTDITGVRSWFGLVNQAAYAFSMTEKMSPFRDSLKPHNKFHWDQDMEQLFQESKKEIVDAVNHGVTLFDLKKKTALTTDWSKVGTGFSLLQKHCSCQSDIPSCCKDGWKLVFAGSQFNNKAETNYAPIEGEALAVVKALHKARFFTLGCDNLIVVTDHKPLLKVFGDRNLEDIHNPRLLSLKEKTLMWRFKIVHIPGKVNKIPDATSRYPSSPPDNHTNDNKFVDTVQATVTSIISALSLLEDNVTMVTWDDVVTETASDPSMIKLMELIMSGFEVDIHTLDPELSQYHQFRDYLYTSDGAIIYKSRVVIPKRLRPKILQNLHAAHQGVTSMNARANASVFWPGITADISKTRANCYSCDKMAPSQPAAPPVKPICPEYPFQAICADYCQKEGCSYLVIVDRYSNWPIVQRIAQGEATAKHFIAALKNHCGTYGIPEEMSSDGGPQLESRETNQFLKDFGIHHRVSSVAFPHSNCRAELGVKTIKRLLTENTGPNGKLDNSKVLRALLQHRNTPDPATGMSPAQVLFGRQIRDFIPVMPGKYKPQKEWKKMMRRREEALSKRHVKCMERLSEHTKRLLPLKVGDTVRIQNQMGTHPGKWDKTGTVVEVKQYDQYLVKVDGTGRATLRNRKFLRKYSPYYQPGNILMGAPATPKQMESREDSQVPLGIDNQQTAAPELQSTQTDIGGQNQTQTTETPASPCVSKPLLNPSTQITPSALPGVLDMPTLSPQKPTYNPGIDRAPEPEPLEMNSPGPEETPMELMQPIS